MDHSNRIVYSFMEIFIGSKMVKHSSTATFWDYMPLSSITKKVEHSMESLKQKTFNHK